MAILIDQITLGSLTIAVLDSDPTTSTGWTADQGSIAVVPSLGQLFVKEGVTATGWSRALTSSVAVDTEQVQDIIGALLADSSSIDFTYNDAGATVDAVIKTGSVTDAMLASGIDAAKIGGGLVSNTEFGYLDGVTSSIQTQLNGKASSAHNHVSTDITDFNEAAQDAVGTALVNSSTITFTYTDASNQITAAVIAGGITHANLASLTSDDHTQYALLAGRAGGQTLSGGNAASNNFTIQSTSNATKGKVVFGAVAAVDEANTRLGIGTISPTSTFSVNTNSTLYTVDQATVATTNATPTAIHTFATTSNTVEYVKVRITGVNAATLDSVAYERSFKVKNNAGTASVVTFQSDYTSEDAALAAANITVTVATSNVSINVVGVTSTNLTWKATVERHR